jgi:hypothetical protein
MVMFERYFLILSQIKPRHMQDSPFADIPETKPQRPIIITVFAIFTFIGCGIAIITAFVPADLFSRGLQSPPPIPPKWIGLVGAALSVVKILGAWQMLKMNKIGFYLYAAGEVAVAALSILTLRVMMDLYEGYVNRAPVDPEWLLKISTGFGLVLSIVFIGVYASQLKKMD